MADLSPAIRYASVCDGIGAVHVAWQQLGWKCEWTAEIDAFPAAVVEQRWGFPNRGDMTKFTEWNDDSFELLVGGTPCQSFSVAGLRKGLHDPRGGLMLTFLEIAQRYRPRWVVWENVPGVLSSNGGRDFGAFLGALGELGYGWAYRVLDAQWFGVAQRRRRVFVVGCLGDERRAAQVLFESESVRRDNPPRREKGQTAPTIPSRRSAGGGFGTDFDCDGGLISATPTIGRTYGKGYGTAEIAGALVAHRLRAEGHDASEDGTGQGTPLVPMAFDWQTGGDMRGIEPKPTAQLQRCQVPAVINHAVRRLTPVECERLQGFPDDWTLVPYRGKPAADGPRYKALGNSMAVPVMRWIGERIARQHTAPEGGEVS